MRDIMSRYKPNFSLNRLKLKKASYEIEQTTLYAFTKLCDTLEKGRKMVKRKVPDFTEIEKFNGIVEVVEVIPPEEDAKYTEDQYHMVIQPTDEVTIEAIKDSKTKKLHNYIRIPSTTEDEYIPEDSGLDKFVTELESCMSEVSDMETHKEVFDYLVGKEFSFAKKKIGRAYQGHEGRKAYVPIKLLE